MNLPPPIMTAGWMRSAREALGPWLDRTLRVEMAACALGALMSLGVGAVVCFVEYWLIYAIFWFATYWYLPTSHATRLLVAGGAMLVIVVSSVRNATDYLADLHFTTGTASDVIVSDSRGRSNINPLAPDSAFSFVKIASAAVAGGPRLILKGIGAVRNFLRLRGIDRAACTDALVLLAADPDRVPLADLAAKIPGGDERLVAQLQLLNGIVRLKVDPPGLTLTHELRMELRGLMPPLEAEGKP